MAQRLWLGGLSLACLMATFPTGLSAAEETPPRKTIVTELSVPALLCVTRMAQILAPKGAITGPPDKPLPVGASFMLGASVQVTDGPEIVVRFPPDHSADILGGNEVTCDREGRILKDTYWR